MKLYVGNLSFETTSEDLARIFSASGRVASAVVVTDRSTGDSRGFGFVEMASQRESDIAIRAINGKEINGRTITVNEAGSREERGGFRGNH
jgi:RNA recognition motif-containing protein